jgi:hypothetical protein
LREAWLALRLAGVEAELRALRTRLDEPFDPARMQARRLELSAWESGCMERAVLRARIRLCRSLRRA